MMLRKIMADMNSMKRSLMPDAPQFFDEWLLANGEPSGPSIKRPKGLRLGAPKQCFCNAFIAVMRERVDTDVWAYTEGMVMRRSLPIPIHHAWLSNRAGEVLELTLRDTDSDEEYFGIPFTLDYVARETFRQKYYGLFSDGIRYNERIMETIAEGRAWEKRA